MEHAHRLIIPRARSRLFDYFECKLNLEGSDITADFTLIYKNPGEADRVLKINIFRRDAAGDRLVNKWDFDVSANVPGFDIYTEQAVSLHYEKPGSVETYFDG